MLSVYFFKIISFKRNGRALTVPLHRKLTHVEAIIPKHFLICFAFNLTHFNNK